MDVYVPSVNDKSTNKPCFPWCGICVIITHQTVHIYSKLKYTLHDCVEITVELMMEEEETAAMHVHHCHSDDDDDWLTGQLSASEREYREKK